MKWILLLLVCVSLACTTSVTPEPRPKAENVGQLVLSTTAAETRVVCRVDPNYGLNLREHAGTANKALAVLPIDSEVTLTGRTEIPVVVTWYEVVAGGKVGWASGAYLCEGE